MLTLSSARNRRSGIDSNIPEDHIILAKHPIIISTLRTSGLKRKICSKGLEMGYPCMPTSDDNRELVVGVRPIPTGQFLKLLSHLGGSGDIEAATLINYGMKVPLTESVMYRKSSYLDLEGFEIPRGYPCNSFDILFTCYTSDLVTIRMRESDGVIEQYVLFTPLDRGPAPAFNIGGSFKRKLIHPHDRDQDADTVVSINTYFPHIHYSISTMSSSVLVRTSNLEHLTLYALVSRAWKPTKKLSPSSKLFLQIALGD